MPGNLGMSRLGNCLPGKDLSPSSILAAAASLDADLTVIGPEAPLVAGVVDAFRAAGRPILGPTAEAAQLEGSKVFSKSFFQQHNIPTAAFVTTDNRESALAALDRFSYPVVIKADGLAAGKGVIIAQDRAQAEAAIDSLGPTLVIEEFLEGEELSFIVLSDGRNVVPFAPSRDHKRAYDNDQGPNTGGMGAFCDPLLLDEAQTTHILERVIWPTVEATGFTGFLYAGIMLTRDGPKVLEFNVRLGDPEAQALLYHLQTDLPELLLAAAQGELGVRQLTWREGVSLCVVMAARGYPGSVRTGDAISGLDAAEETGAIAFHAGTRAGWGGCETAGGRVLGVTASGADRANAAENAYRSVEKIRFDGMQYRTDIGRSPGKTV
jgi:phosphoribosylamine--glycine ligase